MKNTNLKVLALFGALCLCVTLVPTEAQAGKHKDWSVSIGGYNGGVSFGSHGASVHIPGGYVPHYRYPRYYRTGYYHPHIVHRHYGPRYGWVHYGPHYYY